MLTLDTLKHLESRLARYEHSGCVEATRLVRQAIENQGRFASAVAAQALCHAVWGALDKALEDEDDEGTLVALELDGLRAVMAGRLYVLRLALGWLIRASDAPATPPTLAELGL